MAQTVIGSTPAPKVEERSMDPAYKHSIIESTYVPHTSLPSFVPVEPSLVEWYRGSYALDEEQQGFEPDSIETYSSYKRIKNLIVKLDGRPNFQFDPQKAESVESISGYVLFDLTPNLGDLLIKDIGDGRAGLYLIYDQPEIYTVTADKCYHFEARLQAIVTKAIMDNLDLKVIEELYYQKDIAVAGGNAVLTKEDRDVNRLIYEARQGIIDDLLANHYFHDEDTIIIPNENKDILYDPYLAKFLSYVIPDNLTGFRKKICLLNVNYYVNNRKMQEPITVWDMFYRNAFDQPKRYKSEYFVHRSNDMLNTRMYGNVFFSKMERVIVVHKDSAHREPYVYTGAWMPMGPGMEKPLPSGEKYPYFFSDEFYEGGGTELEKFVWKMFKDKTVDKVELLKVLNNYWNLTDIEKLYMGGIYIGACKQVLKTNSSYT